MNETEETPESTDSFGKTLTKQFAYSTAATVGIFVGLAVVGLTVDAANKLKAKRLAKKEAKKAN